MAQAVNIINEDIQSRLDCKKMIDALIEKLPTEQMIVIDGHFRKGKSYSDISKMLGYGKTTIYDRATAGIETLSSIVGKSSENDRTIPNENRTKRAYNISERQKEEGRFDK